MAALEIQDTGRAWILAALVDLVLDASGLTLPFAVVLAAPAVLRLAASSLAPPVVLVLAVPAALMAAAPDLASADWMPTSLSSLMLDFCWLHWLCASAR